MFVRTSLILVRRGGQVLNQVPQLKVYALRHFSRKPVPLSTETPVVFEKKRFPGLRQTTGIDPTDLLTFVKVQQKESQVLRILSEKCTQKPGKGEHNIRMLTMDDSWEDFAIATNHKHPLYATFHSMTREEWTARKYRK